MRITQQIVFPIPQYQVAAGKIDKELLHRILAAILEDTYDMDEELKLDIFNAIR